MPNFTTYLVQGKLDLSQAQAWQQPLIRKVARWLRDGGNIVESLDKGGADNYERLQFAKTLLHAAQLAVRTMRLSGGNTQTGDYVKVVDYSEKHSFRVEVKGRQESNVG